MDVLIRDALDADAPVIATLLTQLGYPSTTEQTADNRTAAEGWVS
ncbi:hypothetical protein AB0L00_01355 [Actinoallomurus sp. NPDC052308]